LTAGVIFGEDILFVKDSKHAYSVVSSTKEGIVSILKVKNINQF